MKTLDVWIITVLFIPLASCTPRHLQSDFKNYRLSNDVLPKSYNITIRPYFLPEDGYKRFTFNGETCITINTYNSSITEFAVHANDLNLTLIDLYSSVGGNKVKFSNKYDDLTNKLIFKLDEELIPCVDYILSFKYTGRINDGFEGLFRSSYTDGDSSSERLILATQLQRINARKLFPCFDEPEFKAYFTIHISRPRNYRSFSNTELLSTTIDNHEENCYIDHFKTTPKMSTYLVAMLISEYIPRTGTDNVISIISRPEYHNKTLFSYKVATKVLNGYNQLFEVPYVKLGNSILQKVSLPKFIHNGMENWGLTIYKDEVLVFEDGNTDLSGMQYSTTIISHETSHNWFGNSITFQWWGYFWLNEAFARYYQYFLTHKLFPQYELDKQFTVDQMHSIFDTDATNSTQPLSEVNVYSPEEIAKKFSSITYVKGASVLRMIEHAMSEPQFQMAIKDYIRSNLNSSVNPSHLLKHLKNCWPSFPRVDVDSFFHDWTETVGFPVINVTLSPDHLKATIQQTRYVHDPNDGSDQHLRYTIPLTFTTNVQKDFNNTYPTFYFNKDQQQIVIDFKEPINWIMFNIQQTGYYRVMYDFDLNKSLKEALLENNWSGIHELNRAQFIDDLFALGRIGLYEYDKVFAWLEYLHTETHYTPWKAALKGFTFIGQFLTPLEHNNFGKYILSVTEKVFRKLGMSSLKHESVLDVYNRNQVLNLNCKYGREECTKEIGKMLKEYLNDGNTIQVDIRSTVYCNGMRNASENDYDKLFEKFKYEKVAREKLRIRNGLACSRNLKNIEKYFEMILSDEIPVEDKVDAITPLFKDNQENVWPVYEIITTRVVDLAKSLGSWSTTAEVVGKVAILITSIEQRNTFEKFIQTNNEIFGVSKSILFDALAKLDYNLNWSRNHLKVLIQFLDRKFN
ncbi:membrane alanyl aminopeptidase-like [Eupeodes corollae]|uniref:membrane alanyl aminopeptidase-like n=1 Tax=Eupeodes corollae TaxID=290404 RepID=UPI002490C8BA|nr:membrane alanyl aminopeptidase-like [Eupeodes corollae]